MDALEKKRLNLFIFFKKKKLFFIVFISLKKLYLNFNPNIIIVKRVKVKLNSI